MGGNSTLPGTRSPSCLIHNLAYFPFVRRRLIASSWTSRYACASPSTSLHLRGAVSSIVALIFFCNSLFHLTLLLPSAEACLGVRLCFLLKSVAPRPPCTVTHAPALGVRRAPVDCYTRKYTRFTVKVSGCRGRRPANPSSWHSACSVK